MSDFSTFFPAGGGGKGAGINSYAPYKVNETVNDNPQGYNYTTGLYTNPVDESVWLKTGKVIKDTVTPNPYPNAFKNPIITENVFIRAINQTGIPQSSAYMALANDYRAGYKDYYLLFNRNGYSANQQFAYKLDSTGTLTGSTIGPLPDLPYFGNGVYAEPIGAGFSASGNSNAGSIWVVYVDVGYGRLYVAEYNLTFTTLLNSYDLGSTPGNVSSPQVNVMSGTWCENAKLIYFTVKRGSYTYPIANQAGLYSYDPANNAIVRRNIGSGGTAVEVPVSVGTNPLTGQIAIGNNYVNQPQKYTTLYEKPGATTPIVQVSPLARSTPTSGPLSSATIQWQNPTSTTGVFTGMTQAMTTSFQSLPGGANGPNLESTLTAASFGDTTARTDSSGSGQPLFIKLK